MGVFVFVFLSALAVYTFGVITRSGSSDFPLHDCSKINMDVIGLLCHPNKDYKTGYATEKSVTQQIGITNTFADNVLRLSHRTILPRVMRATVCDTFSYNKHNTSFSSWQLYNSSLSELYRDNFSIARNTPHLTSNETLVKKIQFVQLLFSQMSGVRKNVTHIAIIFLDGTEISQKDKRNIPHILEEQKKTIQIFVVVFGDENDKETIYLSNTLLLAYDDFNMAGHLLQMAICKQCIPGMFLWEHNTYSKHSLSCYIMVGNNFNNWIQAERYCKTYYGNLAAVETQEELHFLKNQSYTYLKMHANISENSDSIPQLTSGHVFIGLKRNLTSLAKRFKWSRANNRYRPLVINNWMHGRPSGGFDNACVEWKFDWKNHTSNINSSTRGDGFDQGWIDVECDRKTAAKFVLCEVVLPRRVDDIDYMKVKPASKESINKAKQRGDVVHLGNNIVSRSTYIRNTHFINESDSEFGPYFVCGDDDDAGDPRYISYINVCDGIDDCRNRRDETVCISSPRNIYKSKDFEDNKDICSVELCCDGSCLPAHYFNDGEIDCTLCLTNITKLVTDEDFLETSHNNTNITSMCRESACISKSNVGYDCTVSVPHLDETAITHNTFNMCYNISDRQVCITRCVYVVDINGGVLGCRDLSHLKNCTDFECMEGYFKCPKGYCIPQHYVLDGKADCPTGEDEGLYNFLSCSGNFACRNSQICLHPDLVCDGHAECPHQDDEMDCNGSCTAGFRCLSWKVTVSDYNRSIPLASLDFIDRDTRYIDLSGVDLSVLEFGKSLSSLGKIIIIKLSNCKIRNMSSILPLVSINIHTLDISYNLIEIFNYSQRENPYFGNIRYLNLSYNRQLALMNYSQFKFLELLDLSHTMISSLDGSFFQQLPKIKHLNFSYTLISDFNNIQVPPSFVISTLDLRGLSFNNFFENLFKGLRISQYLYTDHFEICCEKVRGDLIPKHICHAPEDAISSCFDLVSVSFQRVLLWGVAALAVLGNVTVIVYRVIWDRQIIKTEYGLFVINLSISDFLMGVYLFIILGADYYYRDVYVLYDKIWRESIVCKLTGFLATFSCETSTYFIFLITLDRFLVIKYPFGQKHIIYMGKMVTLLMSWIIGFFLALIPILFEFEIYSSNAMCFGLPLTAQRLNGWEYSFGVFIVHNFFMFIAIAYGQRAIFKAMSNNRITNTVARTSQRRREDILVAKQLLLIALSNFTFWFPIALLGLLSLCGYNISKDVYAWITIIILPINSAANPLLYTIPTLMDKWKKFKNGDSSTLRH